MAQAATKPKLPAAPSPTRPGWYVPAKWICGILLTAALTVTLPMVAARRLTERSTAIDIVAHIMAGLTSPQGIDSPAGLEAIRTQVKQAGGSMALNFGGTKLTLTSKDLDTLPPRDLRLKVFRQFAADFYDQDGIKAPDVKELLPAELQQELPAEVKQPAVTADEQPDSQGNAGVLQFFTAASHRRISRHVSWLLPLCAVLLAGLMFFARRFGRLAGPGFILALTGAPGLVFHAIATNQAMTPPAARSETASGATEGIGQFIGFVTPLVLPHFINVYIPVLIAGGALLAAAAIGRLVWHPHPAKTPAR